MFRLLKTDHGPHPADKWAVFTAEEIFDTSKLTNVGPWGGRLLDARRVQLAIATALEAVHRKVETAEVDALTADGTARIAAPHDGAAYVEEGIAAVLGAIKGSEWEGHFGRPEVQEEVRQVLAHHFITAQHVQRLWHLNRNPSTTGASAYRARWQGV